MKYKENALDCEDYLKLRESVGWINFSKEQAQEAIDNSLYTVIAIDNKQTVGMGRLVGDGMYGMIVDLVVEPNYQKQGIGSKIVDMLMNFVKKKTPIGGRCSIQLIAEKGKEAFYEERGFKRIPHEFCGSGMRKVIYR
mgnify:CR=1 FL=1